MKRRRFDPPLQKRFVGTVDGFDVYAIEPFAIRNCAEPDEEFDNFATNDEFPDVIPEGQIWVSKHSLRSEGRFFIPNAVARMNARKDGASESTAYTIGLNVERELRTRETGLKYRDGRKHQRVPAAIYHRRYFLLPDEEFRIQVWLVNGSLARTYYKTDYTEGGHGFVYEWVPRDQIWIEKDIHKDEFPFLIAHEYTELRLMRDHGLAYDPAHEIAARVEFDLRKRTSRCKFPGLSTRKFQRADLAKLTQPEYFQYVVEHYQRNFARRLGKVVTDAAARILA